MSKTGRLFAAASSLTIVLCLPLALLSPGGWGFMGEASPGFVLQLQDPPAQNRQELLNPSSLDSLAPAPPTLTSSGGPPWSKSIERLIDEAKFEEARAKLNRETSAQGENHEVLYLKAKLLFKERRFDESLRMLQRCLVLRQDEPRVYMLVASNGLLLDREDVAKPALKSAIQLAPSEVLPRFQLGGLYYTESHFQAAAEELREAVKLRPEFMPAHLFLGSALEELDDRDGALQSFRKAIDLAERQRARQDQPYLFLGRFLARLNRYGEGLPYLQKAVEINPGSSEALYLTGKALNAQGRDTEAIEALLKSVRARPQYPEPHYMLSRIYHKLGRVGEAQQEFRVFLELKRQEKSKDDGRRKRPQNP